MTSGLVTGCSKGIGGATAIELARRGTPGGRERRRPETLVDLPIARRLALDVTDQDSIDAGGDRGR